MQNLSEIENTSLGASAAFVEAILLQPTIYWKNAAQQVQSPLVLVLRAADPCCGRECRLLPTRGLSIEGWVPH